MYYLIAVDSYLWLYFLPLGLIAGPWFFPLLNLIGVLVIVSALWLPGTLAECFVLGQVAVVLILLAPGALAQRPRPGRFDAWLLSKAGNAIRLLFTFTAFFLLIRWGTLRWVSPVISIGWAITLLAFVWKAPWPEPRTRTTWKGAAANTLLLLLSTVAGLAFLEVAARFLYDAPNIRPPGDGLNEYHGEALYTLRPGHSDRYVSYLFDDTKHEFEVRISSQGLREKELGPKSGDEFRILVLGDSFTMGWGVSYEETYPHVLGELLNAARPAKRITVINGGVAGYGPWQERIFLNERCWDLEPDVVLMQLFPENDVANTLTRIGKRLPTYNPQWEDRVSFWRYQDDWRVQAEWRLLAYSRLYYAFTQIADTQIDFDQVFRALRFLRPARREELAPLIARPFHIEVMLSEWYPDLSEGWRMLREDVLDIRSDCQARNIPFVVFTLPSIRVCVNELWIESIAVAPAYAYERYKDVRVAEAFFGEARLVSIEVPSAIINHENPAALYLADGHFSPKGNQVIAEKLAQGLISDILPEYGVFQDNSPSE
jgi:lysophospholipase L1-like esterase